MTPEQIAAWLGFTVDIDLTATTKGREIIAGMADVPDPGPDPTDAHVDVMAAFLSVSGPPPISGWAIRRHQCPVRAVPR